jgi:uncharacterized protein with beta-barrel porin domain
MRHARWHWLVALLATGAMAIASESEGPAPQCSRDFPSLCLNGVTSAVTASDALRATGSRNAELLREKAEESQVAVWTAPGTARGLAAGDVGIAGVGVWASYGQLEFDGDVDIARYNASTDSYTVGADRIFGERFVLGVAVGYEHTTSRTFFNGGGQDTDGVLVSPYAAALLNDYVSVDLAGGYTSLDTDVDRIDPSNGNTLIGEFDSDRYFVSGNVNFTYAPGDWILGLRAGVLYTEETQDGYDESGGPRARVVNQRKVDLTQGSIAIDIAHRFGDFEPYGYFGYRNDFSREDGRKAGGLPATTGRTHTDDDDELEFAVGLRYSGDSALSGSFEWLVTAEREEFDNQSLQVTLRYDFQ